MKVLLVNGSGHVEGCTYTALEEVAGALEKNGIETEIIQVGVEPIAGCIGCGACHDACPWHMPTVNPETGKSSKCIACGACVAGCPSGALSIVDWDAVTSAAQAAYLDL